MIADDVAGEMHREVQYSQRMKILHSTAVGVTNLVSSFSLLTDRSSYALNLSMIKRNTDCYCWSCAMFHFY